MSKWNTSLSLWFKKAILKIVKRAHVCWIFFDITCLQKSQKLLYVRKDARNWASLMNIYAPINKSPNLSKQINIFQDKIFDLFQLNFSWIWDYWWFDLHLSLGESNCLQTAKVTIALILEIVTVFFVKSCLISSLRNTFNIWCEKWLNRILNQEKKLLEKSKKYFPMSRSGKLKF